MPLLLDTLDLHLCIVKFEIAVIYIFFHTSVKKNVGIRRVGIKPGFYHKAQPRGFYEGGFFGFYVGFINLKVYHNSHNQLLPNSFSVLLELV